MLFILKFIINICPHQSSDRNFDVGSSKHIKEILNPFSKFELHQGSAHPLEKKNYPLL